MARPLKYRSVQLWFELETTNPRIYGKRVDASDKAVIRGTLQHEIFENDDIISWSEDDGLLVKVNCRADAVEHYEGPIPYALMVSFEIKSEIDIDVYTRVAEKVRTKVSVI